MYPASKTLCPNPSNFPDEKAPETDVYMDVDDNLLDDDFESEEDAYLKNKCQEEEFRFRVREPYNACPSENSSTMSTMSSG